MEGLECVRDDFIALPVSREHIVSGAYKSPDHPGSRAYRAELLAVARKELGKDRKIFPCPGDCGNCTPKGHACSFLDGVAIVIGIHG